MTCSSGEQPVAASSVDVLYTLVICGAHKFSQGRYATGNINSFSVSFTKFTVPVRFSAAPLRRRCTIVSCRSFDPLRLADSLLACLFACGVVGADGPA